MDVVVSDSGITINDVTVVDPDVLARNGIVHSISAVLIPSSSGGDEPAPTAPTPPAPVAPAPTAPAPPAPFPDLVNVLAADPNYSTLVSLIQTAGLEKAVRTGTLTILAPTNDAFSAVPEATLNALLDDIDALTAVLTYHVIDGVAASSALTSGAVPTLNGETMDVVVSDSGITINGATVVEADILARNGIVHGISAVLIPSGGVDEPAPTAPTPPSPVAPAPTAPNPAPVRIGYPTTWQAQPVTAPAQAPVPVTTPVHQAPAPVTAPVHAPVTAPTPVSPPYRIYAPTTWQAKSSLSAYEEESGTGTVSMTFSYIVASVSLVYAVAMLLL